MKRRLRGLASSLEGTDPWLLGSVLLLLLLGSLVVYGAGSYNRQAAASPLGQHYIIAKHLFMMAVGGVLLGVLLHLDYRWLRNRWLNAGFLALGLLLVALTLLGHRDINRWINVFGFSLQPVEAAKVALVFYLGRQLTRLPQGRTPNWPRLGLIVALGPLPLVILLVLQPNFGNVMVVAGVTVVMLFVAGLPLRRLGLILVVPLGGAVLAFAAVPKLHTRLDRWLDGLGQGAYDYQVQQSLIGLGAGGWRGLGVGQSHNKFFFLPESHTDFAFSVLGEEWGLAGTLGVLVLLLVIVWRGYGIAARSYDPFGRVVAAGLTTSLAIYGVANIAMVTGIFPVVGVPLPFVSYGGTALVAGLASVGILLNIDRIDRSNRDWQRRWDHA